MKPSNNRCQTTATPPASPWDFSKVLRATPPTLGQEIVLTTMQLAPIQEFVPGHFEAALGFTVHTGGWIDYEFNDQQKEKQL